MNNKECTRNCIFALEGVCRLENTHGLKQPQCPFREGSQAAISVL